MSTSYSFIQVFNFHAVCGVSAVKVIILLLRTLTIQREVFGSVGRWKVGRTSNLLGL
jgi:hypothetical protein